MPQTHSTDYVLEPVPKASAEGEKEVSPDNEKVEKEEKQTTNGGLVIFAIDISGSMCSTTQVPALQGPFYLLLLLVLLCVVYSHLCS